MNIKPEFKFGKHLFVRAENYPSSFKPVWDSGVLLGFQRPDGGFDRAKDAIMCGWLIDVSGYQQTLIDDVLQVPWIEIYRA